MSLFKKLYRSEVCTQRTVGKYAKSCAIAIDSHASWDPGGHSTAVGAVSPDHGKTYGVEPGWTLRDRKRRGSMASTLHLPQPMRTSKKANKHPNQMHARSS